MKWNQKYLERIKELRLVDDILLSKVFEDFSCAELLLRIIFRNRSIKVLGIINRHNLPVFHEPGVLLNILAIDSYVRMLNIEVRTMDPKRDVEDRTFERILFDEAVSDHIVWNDLITESYSICISKDGEMDVYFPVYMEKYMKESDHDPFANRIRTMHVDTTYRDHSPLGMLMHDLNCRNAVDMNHTLLAERVKFFKENSEGRKVLIEELERAEQKE